MASKTAASKAKMNNKGESISQEKFFNYITIVSKAIQAIETEYSGPFYIDDGNCSPNTVRAFVDIIDGGAGHRIDDTITLEMRKEGNPPSKPQPLSSKGMVDTSVEGAEQMNEKLAQFREDIRRMIVDLGKKPNITVKVGSAWKKKK